MHPSTERVTRQYLPVSCFNFVESSKVYYKVKETHLYCFLRLIENTFVNFFLPQLMFKLSVMHLLSLLHLIYSGELFVPFAISCAAFILAIIIFLSLIFVIYFIFF